MIPVTEVPPHWGARLIRSATWHAEDFGSGCAGLRNMPAGARRCFYNHFSLA
jgi:hypothetical protein